MTNKDVSKLFKETAALIEMTGGNPFRARAFAGAARRIERLEDPVSRLAREGTLTEIEGIGDGLASQIDEILQTGSFEVRDDLLGAIPPGLLDVLAVKGLGAKKIRVLWQSLGVQSLDDLEEVARTGRVQDLDGFGSKSQESILENVTALRSYLQRRRYSDAIQSTRAATRKLLDAGVVTELIHVGELGRKLETVGAIDLLAPLPDTGIPDDLSPAYSEVERVESAGYAGLQAQAPTGLALTVYFAPAHEFGRARVLLTGPQAFLDDFGTPPPAETEEDVFRKAGVPYLAPELRDLPDAVSRAADLSKLDLIEEEDLRGIIHNHSTYSDGAHSLKEMADACRSMGYEYFGIADHSQSLKVAGGMTPEEVKRQHAEVARLNEAYAADDGEDFRIFFGVESDILSDGSLDYDDDILELFDYVVASVHQGFNMTEAQATERIITAVSNPFTSILGHPTGRLLLRREGYRIDHEAVLDACAAYGVSVELNANPYRLDLDWRYLEAAIERGVPVSINPDAHSTGQLHLMYWGVCVARKGGLTARDCLNARSLDDFRNWLDARQPSGST